MSARGPGAAAGRNPPRPARRARRPPGRRRHGGPRPAPARPLGHRGRRGAAGRTPRRRRRLLLRPPPARPRPVRRRPRGARLPVAGRLRERHARDRGRLPIPALPRRPGPPPDRRGPPRGAVEGPRRGAHGPPGRHRHPLHRLGAQRARGAGDRHLQLLGRHRLPDALAGRHGRLGAVRPRGRRGRALQVRDHPPRRQPHPARRPDGPPHRVPARDRLRDHLLGLRVGRPGVAGAARRGPRPRGAALRLRGAPAVLAAGAGLPGARRAAARVRRGARLHPRRADAGRRAPLRRLLGLPGHRLLRPDGPDGHPGRLQVPGRQPAPGRHRRDHGLGARALPA